MANFYGQYIGFGSGGGATAPVTPYGEVAGYVHGGFQLGVPNGETVDTIDRVSFTSDGNSTDVANLYQRNGYGTGVSSATYGYTCGGQTYPPTGQEVNRIEKFQFGTTNTGTDVADLQATKQQLGGGTMNQTHGYIHGGLSAPSTYFDVIDKFTYATEADATDHGDLTESKKATSSCSSSTHGYACGGSMAPRSNVIDKYAFSSNTTASDIGNLTTARSFWSAGSMSDTYGYCHGGDDPYQNTIDRFSFSSDGDATDWADLSYTWAYMAGLASTTHGYAAGGYTSGGTTGPISGYTNYIEKYPYATETNASDVGDLSTSRYGGSGTHY